MLEDRLAEYVPVCSLFALVSLEHPVSPWRRQQARAFAASPLWLWTQLLDPRTVVLSQRTPGQTDRRPSAAHRISVLIAQSIHEWKDRHLDPSTVQGIFLLVVKVRHDCWIEQAGGLRTDRLEACIGLGGSGEGGEARGWRRTCWLARHVR